MVNRSTVRSPRHRVRIFGIGLSAAVLACGSIVFAGADRAGAALVTTGGTCGFRLGGPFQTGALGTFGFEFPVYPANIHQVCSVTVTAQASFEPAAGSFTNVASDPSTKTLTLTFSGGPLPLGIVWLWSPHCADPPAPGILTLTVDGQSASSVPQTATSCLPDFGGASSLSFNSIDAANTNVALGLASTTDGHGYWAIAASGEILARGDATLTGPLPALNRPAVGVSADPIGHGYWVVASDGGVFSFGGAGFYGSLGGVTLNAPVVGMTPTPDGGGYWLVAADGGVFAFGDAVFHNSLSGMRLNAPVVGMAPTPDGGGYWLVAADGGIFAFGDAVFHGSLGGMALNAPVVGMAATPDGRGYWLAAYDGGVFSLGDAPFEGSAGNLPLAAPVYAMARTPTGLGYWLLGGDGGIFTYGDAGFFGATPLQ